MTADFELPGPLPLRWWRYYHSGRNTVACPLGWGHTHHFDRSLHQDLDGLRYLNPSGDMIGFPALAKGDEVAQDGFLLRRVTANLYQLEEPGQPLMEFELADGRRCAPLCRLRQDDAVLTLRYASSGHLQEIVDFQGRLLRVGVDHAGRITSLALVRADRTSPDRTLMSYEYDAAGNLILARDPGQLTLQFQYDHNHRLIRKTDRRGYAFHFTYDEEGRCIHTCGDDGLLEVHLDYQPDIKATFVRRADGGQWCYFYDEAGTLTQIVDPYGGTTKFTIDEEGRTSEEIDPNGNVTQLLYDDFGRHHLRIDPLGRELPPFEEEPEPNHPLAYDVPATPLEWEYGHLLDPGAIVPTGPDDPVLQLFPPAIFNTVLGRTTAYDLTGTNETPSAEDGLPVWPEEFLGPPFTTPPPTAAEQWKFDANGNLAEYRDRDGSVYRFQHTSWNLVQQTIDPLHRVTSFAYSPERQITKVVDPGGTVTEFGYDQKDRLVEFRYQGQCLERYSCDKVANVIEKKNGRGCTLVTWQVGPGNLDTACRLATGETHNYQYDDQGHMIEAATPDGIVTCAFTEDGRQATDCRDGLGVVHDFDLGQLVRTTYFDQFKITYGTDAQGDLVITDPTGMVHRIKVSGNLIARLLANGTQELCQYDRHGRCRRKAVSHRLDGSNWIRSYAYSAEGDLRAVHDTQVGTTRYRHDAAHRLVEEILRDGTRRSFEHDAAGNLLSQPGLMHVTIGPGNRLQTANGDTFTYNDRGHVSCRQGPGHTTHYDYNALDQLVRSEINGQVWTAAYDGLHRRIRKTWQGQTTTYYWDNLRLAAEVRDNGSVRLYLYADEVSLVPFMFVEYDALDADPASGRRYYVFTNQIGVPIQVEDDEGKTVWSARLDPYGQVHVHPASTLEMPLRFPGHYHDPETGLHYNWHRYYSPELGRYLQLDPLGIEGGIHQYGSIENPLTEVDIDGLKSPAKAANCRTSNGSGRTKPAPKARSTKPPASKPKPPKQRPPKQGFVKKFEVGKFKNLAVRAKRGDKLTPDHIPSNGANLKAALEKKKKQFGPRAKLTKKEKKEIRDNGNCIMVPDKLHKEGRTHGGKNTQKQIEQDAKDLKTAAQKDMDAHRNNVSDKDKKDLEKGLKKLEEANNPKPKPKAKAKK